METPFAAFIRLAAFLAAADGAAQREIEELRSVVTTLAEQAELDLDIAMDQAKQALQEPTLDAEGFYRVASQIGQWSGERREVLQSLYHELVQVAGADRDIGEAERFMLDAVRDLWQL